MAKKKFSIDYAPFPDHINRDMFGQWLSGFTDGEGCFRLFYYFFKGKHGTRQIPAAMFSIRLRADDHDALALIQSYFQCGGLQYNNKSYEDYPKRKPQWTFVIYRTQQLANVVVPHFDRYPLFAKKARDFAIFKEGVTLKLAVHGRPLTGNRRKGTQPKYTTEELERFDYLVKSLKHTRAYKDSSSDFQTHTPLRSPTRPGRTQLFLPLE